ncbi:MAG: pyruvate dehydrogenase (acetyl-transferring) E1 component subunit alpha, partial [Planctomycetes bacterium]|nr:pyruvate dehydrogenase (acetyl-transferring) E1 component subunit alpha [Planctomycetota bacterium]
MTKLSPEQLAGMYETMLTIRRFEEKAHELFLADRV